MKPETKTIRSLFPIVAAALLALAMLACGPLTPTPEPTPTLFVPTEPLPTEEPTPAPTKPPPPEPAPTASPVPVVCPAPGSPTLIQPANFADYPIAIQQFLSAGGDVATLENVLAGWNALSPDVTGQVVTTDLTGDGVAEVVVALKDPNGDITFSASDLLIFGCQAGDYILHHRESTDGLIVRVYQVSDVNLDGWPDVVYTLGSCGAHTCWEMLEILGWDGAARWRCRTPPTPSRLDASRPKAAASGRWGRSLSVATPRCGS